MIVVGIDPGYSRSGEGCAVAVLRDGVLDSVCFARPGDWLLRCAAVSNVVIEKPQQDRRSRAIPPAVLIELAWQGAALAYSIAASSGARVVAITPSAWKGSTPKPVQHRQLWAKLSAAERAILGGDATDAAIARAQDAGALDRWSRPGASYYPRSFATHNLLDAVGIAFAYEGR